MKSKYKTMKESLLKVLFFTGIALVANSCNVKAETIKTPAVTIETANKKKVQQTIKVALLLDTSNSMDGLINQAKAQLWDIVNELSYAKCKGETPNLKIALYEYGNKSLSEKSGYIKQVSEFTNDLDEISESLFGLVTNGGDEFCGQVIDKAVRNLEWGNDKDDLKMIFIAGNESFKQGPFNFTTAIENAKENDITVNTIFCGDTYQGIKSGWKEGADVGAGDYMNIDHHKKLVHIVTPYDDEIIILNKKLNKTYIHYGSNGASKYQKQAIQDSNASDLNEEVAVKRAVTKSSKLYSNASWDLVDATKNKKIKYSSINKKQLPEELQNKSTEEIKTYVAKKSKERENIQKSIKQLNKERSQYVAKKQKENATNDGLENVLIKTIKKQAERKNYTW